MHDIIFAIIHCLLSSAAGVSADGGRKALGETARLVRERIDRMPVYLGVPMMILTYLFEWSGLVAYGKFFSRLDEKHQDMQIVRWKKSRIGIGREFIYFYEKMGTFVYFSLTAATVADKPEAVNA